MAIQSEWDPKPIEVGQDLPFQDRMWLFQRVGWVAMVAIVAVAALGLFGHGPIAAGSSATADGTVQLSFDRIARHGVPTSVTIRVDRSLAEDGKITIWVSREWLRGVELENVIPDPAEAHEAPGDVGFEFNVADGPGPFEATLDLRYDDVGVRSASVRTRDRTVFLDQFVWP